jgi:hypothetical protein
MDLTALRRQHAQSRAVSFSKGGAHNAPGKKRHASTSANLRREKGCRKRRSGGKYLTTRAQKAARQRRKQRLDLGKFQEPQNAGATSEPLKAQALIETQEVIDRAKEAHALEYMAEHQPAQEPLAQRARASALDLGARRFHQLPIGHTRGANGFACPAIQALIHLAYKARTGQA